MKRILGFLTVLMAYSCLGQSPNLYVGKFQGDGSLLTNLPASGSATNAIANNNGYGTNTALVGQGTLPQRTFYVATNGNDATAVIGSPIYPWSTNFSTNSGIFTIATNYGDVINFFPGNYYVSNIWVKDGITIQGTQPRPAAYFHALTNGAASGHNGTATYSCFVLGNNCTVRNIAWEGTNCYPAGAGNFFVYFALAQTTTAVNLLFENCELHGGTDVFYDHNSGQVPCTNVVLRSCFVDSQDDIFACPGGSSLISYNCYFYPSIQTKGGFEGAGGFTDFGSTFSNITAGVSVLQQTGEPLALYGSVFVGPSPLNLVTNSPFTSGFFSYQGISYTISPQSGSFPSLSATSELSTNTTVTNLFTLGGAGLVNAQPSAVTNNVIFLGADKSGASSLGYTYQSSTLPAAIVSALSLSHNGFYNYWSNSGSGWLIITNYNNDFALGSSLKYFADTYADLVSGFSAGPYYVASGIGLAFTNCSILWNAVNGALVSPLTVEFGQYQASLTIGTTNGPYVYPLAMQLNGGLNVTGTSVFGFGSGGILSGASIQAVSVTSTNGLTNFSGIFSNGGPAQVAGSLTTYSNGIVAGLLASNNLTAVAVGTLSVSNLQLYGTAAGNGGSLTNLGGSKWVVNVQSPSIISNIGWAIPGLGMYQIAIDYYGTNLGSFYFSNLTHTSLSGPAITNAYFNAAAGVQSSNIVSCGRFIGYADGGDTVTLSNTSPVGSAIYIKGVTLISTP